MKRLTIPALLLAATSASGAAVLPSGLTAATDGRSTDYNTWFQEFKVASNATYYAEPFPVGTLAHPMGTPDPFIDADRAWAGWSENWEAGLTGPIVGGADYRLDVEFVFLGETAGWWNDIGYRFNGVDYLLADGVQAVGGLTRVFGDYAYFTLETGDTLDFFVTGSQITSQDDAITVGGAAGGKYYVYDKSLNVPMGADRQSYFGTLTPLSSVRGSEFLGDETGTIPFSVLGFEDINIPSGSSDRDYNDILFAFRSGNLIPDGPIPEPSTYGLIGAAGLLALAGYRRFKRRES